MDGPWKVTAVAGIAAWAVACGLPETIEDGCRDGIGGVGLDDDLAPGFEHLDCVRGYLGLSRVAASEGVLTMSRGHAGWLEAHPPPLDNGRPPRRSAWMIQADPEAEAFTGRTPTARAEAAFVPLEDAHAWGFVLPDTGGQNTGWIDDPFYRDMLLQPGLRAIGAARLDASHLVVDAVASLPANRAIHRPVAWPRDGETGVPVAWVPDGVAGNPPIAADPVSSGGYGYPVSWTFGAGGVLDVHRALSNPLGLVVDQEAGGASLVPASGDAVPIEAILPFEGLDTPAWLVTTVVLVPLAPLEADTRYTATVHLTTRFGPVTARTAFTTGPETADTD